MSKNKPRRIPGVRVEWRVMRFLAIKKWKKGGETIMEYFSTKTEALIWISKQRQPRKDEFRWYVGEYA